MVKHMQISPQFLTLVIKISCFSFVISRASCGRFLFNLIERSCKLIGMLCFIIVRVKLITTSIGVTTCLCLHRWHKFYQELWIAWLLNRFHYFIKQYLIYSLTIVQILAEDHFVVLFNSVSLNKIF